MKKENDALSSIYRKTIAIIYYCYLSRFPFCLLFFSLHFNMVSELYPTEREGFFQPIKKTTTLPSKFNLQTALPSDPRRAVGTTSNSPFQSTEAWRCSAQLQVQLGQTAQDTERGPPPADTTAVHSGPRKNYPLHSVRVVSNKNLVYLSLSSLPH